METIGLASDHAGFELKALLIEYLESHGYKTKDYGCFSCDSVDYPDFGHALARGLENKECTLGVAMCGSANGITMALNKHQSIRAAICWEPDIASLARQHNDANVCSIPARFVSTTKAINILNAYLTTSFEGGRHQRRVEKIEIK